MIFKGVCTALVTPFAKNKKVDYKALEKILKFQIENGVDAILILGTTGESSTISQQEREQIIKFSKKTINKKCKLIVGTGSNDTLKTIELTNQASKLGADGCLIVTPYYNKCTQKGIYNHYKTISQNTNIPYIVYNVPSRTGFNIEPKTMQKIVTLKNVVGLKEANTSIDHILSMFQTLQNFPIYCGNDNLSHVFYSLNGSGIISVTSNAFPSEVKKSYKNKKESLWYFKKFYNFNNLMFCEPNPIPVKYVLYKKGLIKNCLRQPLENLEYKHKKMIDNELKKMEII